MWWDPLLPWPPLLLVDSGCWGHPQLACGAEHPMLPAVHPTGRKPVGGRGGDNWKTSLPLPPGDTPTPLCPTLCIVASPHPSSLETLPMTLNITRSCAPLRWQPPPPHTPAWPCPGPPQSSSPLYPSSVPLNRALLPSGPTSLPVPQHLHPTPSTSSSAPVLSVLSHSPCDTPCALPSPSPPLDPLQTPLLPSRPSLGFCAPHSGLPRAPLEPSRPLCPFLRSSLLVFFTRPPQGTVYFPPLFLPNRHRWQSQGAPE